MRKMKDEKHLDFLISLKEYSEFWYIGSLLNSNKKNAILRKMMSITKSVLEKKEITDERKD